MSNYKRYFDENKIEVNKRAIATKIIDMIQKLELNNTQDSARRWVWELIQNAKDVSDEGVVIKIDVEEDTVRFRHDGKPFKVIHLTSLINQVSAKDRNDKSTTGKFGTGFLTTHLLSKIVEVEGVLKEDTNPYKQFTITLDRTSSDIAKLAATVEETMYYLDQIDSMPDIDYNVGDFATRFTYHLTTHTAKRIAQAGYEDLINCIDYVLICQPKVKEIILNGEAIYCKEVTHKCLGKLEGKVYKVTNGEDERYYIASALNDTSIILPIQLIGQSVQLEQISHNIPRIFCDFPCVGTEQFMFPVIINNPYFHLTEPRDGIYLTMNDNPQVQQNKRIIDEAITLWRQLLEYLVKQYPGVIGFEQLFYFSKFKSYEWQDESYIEQAIYNKMKRLGEEIEFIQVEGSASLYRMRDVCIPDFDTEEEVVLAMPVLEALQQKPLVRRNKVQDYKSMWCYREFFWGYEQIANQLESYGSLETLQRNIKSNKLAIEVVNQTLALFRLSEVWWTTIKKRNIYPMIDGRFAHCTLKKSLGKVDEPVRQQYINHLISKNSVRDSLKLFSQNEHTTEQYVHLGLNLEGLDIAETTTQDILAYINNGYGEKGRTHKLLFLVQVTPHSSHELYKKQQALFSIVAHNHEITPIIIENYSKEYLLEFEKDYIEYYFKSNLYKQGNFECINEIIEYMLTYNLKGIEWCITTLFNENATRVDRNQMRYNQVTKPELFELYCQCNASITHKIVSKKYRRLDEMVNLPYIGDIIATDTITKKVFDVLSKPEQTIEQRDFLQKVYNYLETHYQDIDEEFPALKEKMYYLCSKEVLMENQSIVQSIRQAAEQQGVSVETFMQNMQRQQKAVGDSIWDDEIYDALEYDLQRRSEIGQKGEIYAYEMIIQEYVNQGYEVLERNNWIINLVYGEKEIQIQLFYGTNQQGYDLVVRENGKIVKYIEIKTTVKEWIQYVRLSAMQLAQASICYWEKEAEYEVICILNIEGTVKVVRLNNPFQQLYQNKLKMEVALCLVDNNIA